MENKVVFITGAAGGIGLSIGERFAESGATVVIRICSKISSTFFQK